MLYRHFLPFCQRMKWIFKKIDRDRQKSAEIITLRIIFYLIGRFWHDILLRQDGGSKKEGICRGIQPHDDIFLLEGIHDESNRKSTFRIIFVRIFRKIVILLVTTYTHRTGNDAILDFQQWIVFKYPNWYR